MAKVINNIKFILKSLYTEKNLESLLPSYNLYNVKDENILKIFFDHNQEKTLYTITINNEMKNENELISFLKILQQLFLGFYPPSLHYCIFPSIYKNREYCTLYTFLTL